MSGLQWLAGSGCAWPVVAQGRAGPGLRAFASGKPGSRGNLLRHEKLAEFIGRNYLVEADGRWYFQNGPQRVYVELESAPWIWRLRYAEHGLQLHSHTGQELAAEQVQQVLLDELGRLFLALPQGLGMVHSLDMLDAANALESGALPEAQEIESALLPLQFGFVPSPGGLSSLIAAFVCVQRV
jgi:hypothetical protein